MTNQGVLKVKIGQLTFHASHNYGSVLQAYALATKLRTLGHETEFINLRPKSQRDAYKIIRKSHRGIRRIFRYIIYPALKRRYNHFERFINKVLPVTKEEYATTEALQNANFHYDAYICGGDQIWNPACLDFETAYYLQFLSEGNDARKVSYSPSFGKTEFDEDTLKNIKKWLEKFDFISVREKRGAELVRKLTDKDVQMVCDPVLLLDRNEWEKLAVRPRIKKTYILVYFLENNHGSRHLIDYLKKTTGYDVVVFNEYIRDFVKPYHKAYGASPEEFVGLFMNASFIYTNSFHGTVFATIFEKPFLTAIAIDQENAVNNNDSRKIDYLNQIGLGKRLYTYGEPHETVFSNDDVVDAKSKIDTFRNESLNYLLKAIGV